MAQNFHKILQKPFNGGAFKALFNHHTPLKSITPHLLHHPKIAPTESDTENPFPASPSEFKSTHFNEFRIYPSFSFGYFLNPISPSGFPEPKPVEDPKLDGSVSGMIWADSVKKKRKKKMNKHKLKKLKKRLRHCS